MEVLEKIFGSAAKVKIMRLFLFNPQDMFAIKDITNRTKVKKDAAKKEITKLEKIGLIRKRSVKRKSHWILDPKFLYIKPLKEFLVEMGPLKHSDIASRLKKSGQVKLLVVSGVFTHDNESRIDLLVVGDKLKKKTLETAVRDMEAEIGKELVYAVFDTPDFEYRMGMYDKLLRDILDYPHQKIVNKFGDLS